MSNRSKGKGKSFKNETGENPEPSSNGLKTGKQGNLDSDPKPIAGFDENFQETYHQIQGKKNVNIPLNQHIKDPSNIEDRPPKRYQPEVIKEAYERSSANSDEGKKRLKGKKSSRPKFECPNRDWIADLCKQTQCLNKVKGIWQTFMVMKNIQKAGVIFLATFITALIIGISIIISKIAGPPTEGMFMSPLEYNGTIVSALYTEGRTKNNHTYWTHQTHWKHEASHPTLEAVTKMVVTSSNQLQIHCNVPILSLLAVCGIAHKQSQSYEQWLEYYNSNPQRVIEKLTSTMNDALVRTGTYKFGQRKYDNLTLVSWTDGVSIEVQYEPIQKIFIASNANQQPIERNSDNSQTNALQNNLKAEDTQNQEQKSLSPTSEGTKKVEAKPQSQKDRHVSEQDLKNFSEKTEQEKQSLMSRTILQSVYYIKRVVARNVQVLRAKSAQLMAYQQKLVDGNEISQEWQKALVNGCRTLQSLRFRCTIEAAGVLVPGLTLEKVKSDDGYLVSQTLNLVFKEVKETTQ